MPDTVHASLGPATPTTFDVGPYGQRKVGVNLDLSHALTEGVHLAGGVEWRREQFRVCLGRPESWRQGGVYGDVEVGGERGWVLGAAVRLERYEDFGATLNGKLSGAPVRERRPPRRPRHRVAGPRPGPAERVQRFRRSTSSRSTTWSTTARSPPRRPSPGCAAAGR